jgi:hypothetical protein
VRAAVTDTIDDTTTTTTTATRITTATAALSSDDWKWTYNGGVIGHLCCFLFLCFVSPLECSIFLRSLALPLYPSCYIERREG